MMKRIFLAVPVTQKIIRELAKEIERLKKSLPDWEIKWVTPENLHITLVFFGWVKEDQIKNLKTEIEALVPKSTPFQITTGKLFLKVRPLWLEIEQGREELNRLAEEIGHQLTIKGSLKEERGFYPHLTLGRVKKRGKIKLPLVHEEFSWKANRLVLYESRFVRKQRVYEELFPFPLKGN
ncbi:MAG: 2'-5' RNA ligase, 2'-5' RNA ligase [candidate division WWE3 bacterium CSP1-7]|uniref:RNA 2',3'-cyclic phosphodiesterase n=1 Tax=candidate division WWE3 bacterium CSP1-7 TaxID=1576480 RepID=A0A0T5ZY41_UNCKA|nr:MAG: 2'-5' RNA ligase, 2'-5' RNA ligase [candidate division WWE3 bacterium CSP1-7]